MPPKLNAAPRSTVVTKHTYLVGNISPIWDILADQNWRFGRLLSGAFLPFRSLHVQLSGGNASVRRWGRRRGTPDPWELGSRRGSRYDR